MAGLGVVEEKQEPPINSLLWRPQLRPELINWCWCQDDEGEAEAEAEAETEDHLGLSVVIFDRSG